MKTGESLTLAEAAKLLDCTRPTVDARIADEALELVAGSSPARVTRASVVRELGRMIMEQALKLNRLRAAAHELGGPAHSSGPDDHLLRRLLELADEVQQERIGRAAAETRIDQLKADLRRANAAIAALTPDPDQGL